MTASCRSSRPRSASSTCKRSTTTTTACGAISGSTTSTTSSRRSTAGSTAEMSAGCPTPRRVSVRSASPSMGLRPSRGRSRAAASSGERVARCTSCTARTSSPARSASASSCATRTPASLPELWTCGPRSTTRLIICRVGLSSPSRCPRPRTITCWFAPAGSAGRRRTWWLATSTRPAFRTSAPGRRAGRGLRGSTTTSGSVSLPAPTTPASAAAACAVDVTLRKSTDSWVKLQTGKSDGLVSGSFYSADGGFGFTSYNPSSFANASAEAYRADVSLGLGDLLSGNKGRLACYTQHLDAGYSAPGLNALTGTEYYGGTFKLPIGDRWSLNAKADRKAQDQGLETTAEELDVAYKLSKNWSVSTGVRRDDRQDNSPAVPATQQQGERTDVVAQLGYGSLATWRAYTFIQDTVSKSGDRDDNGRAGVGGSYRVTNKLQIEAEGSEGSLGPGGKLGTSYLASDHTSLYLNYSLENERADSGVFQRQGTLVSGMKQRLSDSSNVYVEERYQDIDSASGLTHATGVTLAPDDRWNIGANAEVGTLVDSQTDAQTKRKAGGIRVGYGRGRIQASSGIEYRDDEMQQPNATTSKLKTRLFRNNFKFQIAPDWRLVGKLDHSMSENSQGQFYDGGYTEAVLGYGYRPVQSDRLGVLAKYHYFYNVPTAAQVTPQDTAAQFIQKSHIASFDVSYDLTRQWSVGGKYAYRLGQASLDRVNPQFFDNTAELYIVRIDWHFHQEWEGMIEGRVLDMPDLNESRSGALVAVYRHLGKHVKAGLGYNFK